MTKIEQFFLFRRTAYIAVFFVTLTVMILIDASLGETAEYLNAWIILILLTKWVHHQNPPTDRYFFLQDSLGNFSLLVGTLSLILIHAILSFLIVTLIRALLSKKSLSEIR